jgi:hypothetical protein
MHSRHDESCSRVESLCNEKKHGFRLAHFLKDRSEKKVEEPFEIRQVRVSVNRMVVKD